MSFFDCKFQSLIFNDKVLNIDFVFLKPYKTRLQYCKKFPLWTFKIVLLFHFFSYVESHTLLRNELQSVSNASNPFEIKDKNTIDQVLVSNTLHIFALIKRTSKYIYQIIELLKNTTFNEGILNYKTKLIHHLKKCI